jgi:hypothetical protein
MQAADRMPEKDQEEKRKNKAQDRLWAWLAFIAVVMIVAVLVTYRFHRFL